MKTQVFAESTNFTQPLKCGTWVSINFCYLQLSHASVQLCPPNVMAHVFQFVKFVFGCLIQIRPDNHDSVPFWVEYIQPATHAFFAQLTTIPGAKQDAELDSELHGHSGDSSGKRRSKGDVFNAVWSICVLHNAFLSNALSPLASGAVGTSTSLRIDQPGQRTSSRHRPSP